MICINQPQNGTIVPKHVFKEALHDLKDKDYLQDKYDLVKGCMAVFVEFKSELLVYGPFVTSCKRATTLIQSANHDSNSKEEVVAIEKRLKMMALKELPDDYKYRSWTMPSNLAKLLALPLEQIIGYV